MGQEEVPAVDFADVYPLELALFQELGDVFRIPRMTEGAREHVAEAVRHGDEGNVESHRGRCGGTLGRISADAGEMGEICLARPGPAQERAEAPVRADRSCVATLLEQIVQTARGGQGAAFP